MTKGVLPWQDLLDAINLNTGFFETSQYILANQMRIIAGNWDGAGMSAGNLQYNWGPADRLSEFFTYMFNNYESVIQECFGAETAKFDEFKTVCTTYTRAQKIAWGETITDYTQPSPAGHALIEPWKTILGDLMARPESHPKYTQMMEAYYLSDALDLFKQLNCVSRASLASLFDLSINRGRYYPCNTLVVDFEEIDANGALTADEKEAQKIYQINVRGNDPTNGMDASASSFAPRRMAQANQGGTYYGATYDPETQFDINQEPAITEKAPTQGTMGVKLGTIDIQNIYLGNALIQNLYLGANLLSQQAGDPVPYTTSKVPDTQFRTNSNSYAGFETGPITLDAGQKLWIDVQNFVACKTYYTIDGSTPTENSNLYRENLTFDNSCTLKVLNKSVSGISESIRTLDITIRPVTAGWRYVRLVGHGDQTSTTTRLVELQALEGATNRLLNKLPMAGYATPNGGTIAVATDGAKVQSSGYPFWWTGEGVPDLHYDLGANYPIDTINVTGYSTAGDPRQTQFELYVSTDNTNWTLVIDYSANVTNQPTTGFNFTVPAS